MALDHKTTKIVLDERDLPTHWYNVVPDLPSPPAPPSSSGCSRGAAACWSFRANPRPRLRLTSWPAGGRSPTPTC